MCYNYTRYILAFADKTKEKITMALKMRAVYYGSKKLKAIAEALSTDAEKKADTIPPAYNVESVRLLVVCIKAAKNYSDTIMRFFDALDKQRAANVAFIVEGAEGSVDNVISTVKEAGANVIPSVLYTKGGLFASAKPEDIAEAKKWLEDVIKTVTG